MTTTVTGLYPDLAAAERAVSDLVAHGFPRAEISVILRSTPDHDRLVHEEMEDAPRGALFGAVAGGALASLAFGALAFSGIGLVAAGPLLVALTAGGAGAAAGSLVGGLVAHGVSSGVADEYETAIQNGAVLVVVHTVHAHAREARAGLVQSGAANIADSVHPAWMHREDQGTL